MLSVVALAERGRSQIPSVSEANQLEPGPEQGVLAAEAADPAILSFPRERPARSGPPVLMRPGGDDAETLSPRGHHAEQSRVNNVCDAG